MDPVTIIIALAVVGFVALRSPPPAVQAVEAQRQGALPPMGGPPQDAVPSLAHAMYAGAHATGSNFRNTVSAVVTNTLATAKQRAQSVTGGLDPAFVSSGSANASRDFVTRGLNTTRGAAQQAVNFGWSVSVPGIVSRTQTGQAVQQVVQTGVTQTGAAVIAAGGSVADAGAQAATNAVNSVSNAAASADAATASFISRNSPF